MNDEKITIEWANPERNLIRVIYKQRGWTWRELEAIFKQQFALIETVTHPRVDILIEVGASNWLPTGIPLLSVVKNVAQYIHPRQGCTVIVGARGFLKALSDSIMRLRSMTYRNFHFVDTLPQAQALLDEVRRQRDKANSRAAG